MVQRIDLTIHFHDSSYMSQRIKDVPCVPPPGTYIQTENGRGRVLEVSYDFDSYNNTVVTLSVDVNQDSHDSTYRSAHLSG